MDQFCIICSLSATWAIPTMEPSAEELEEEVQEGYNQIDRKIEEEEEKADNLVIRDLMDSTKPEPNKVGYLQRSNASLSFPPPPLVVEKMSDEERRAMYDNVDSKLLTLLERCQIYVYHRKYQGETVHRRASQEERHYHR